MHTRSAHAVHEGRERFGLVENPILVLIETRIQKEFAQIMNMIAICIQTRSALRQTRIAAAAWIADSRRRAAIRVAQVRTASVAGVTAALRRAKMPIRVAKHIAPSARAIRIAQTATEVARSPAAARIAQRVHGANQRVAAIGAILAASVAAAKRAARRIGTSRRASVAAAERIACTTFGQGTGVRVANQVARRSRAVRLTNTAGRAGIAAACRSTESIGGTDNGTALIGTAGITRVAAAKNVALGMTTRVTQIAAAKGVALLALFVGTGVGVAEKIAPSLGAGRIAKASRRARVATASRIAQHAFRTEQHVAGIPAASRVAQQVLVAHHRIALVGTALATGASAEIA